MKIIFDSEEQKNAFFGLMADDYCPNCLLLPEHCLAERDCDLCWRSCGIKVEVKKDE